MQLESNYEQGTVVDLDVNKDCRVGYIIVANNDAVIEVPLDIAQFKEIQGYLDKELGGKEDV